MTDNRPLYRMFWTTTQFTHNKRSSGAECGCITRGDGQKIRICQECSPGHVAGIKARMGGSVRAA